MNKKVIIIFMIIFVGFILLIVYHDFKSTDNNIVVNESNEEIKAEANDMVGEEYLEDDF